MKVGGIQVSIFLVLCIVVAGELSRTNIVKFMYIVAYLTLLTQSN